MRTFRKLWGAKRRCRARRACHNAVFAARLQRLARVITRNALLAVPSRTELVHASGRCTRSSQR